LALDFGLAVTVSGGSLMAGAHFGARPDLWPLGVPIAIVGLVLLLAGLVFQFDEPDREKSRAADRAYDRIPQPALGRSRVRFENESDNTSLLKDLAARLDEVTKRLEGREE
jgi:hypothetical protein